ncbi:Methylglyoxal synthase [termite gut metagenome]|uniref:Methylglyoxal synthase n=1 Tax=termite gut metagenome TaxID=433724 RepID=A0A5J4QXK4_9ZZZZ
MNNKNKTIALVSHDRMKKAMIKWVVWNAEKLSYYKLVCTGTTGKMIERAVKVERPNIKLDIECKKSGPCGGDQQIGGMIVDGLIFALIFFEDNMSSNPHESDIRALERQAKMHNIFVGCNLSTADCILCSPLFTDDEYISKIKDMEYKEFDREAFEREMKEGKTFLVDCKTEPEFIQINQKIAIEDSDFIGVVTQEEEY